MVIVTYQWADLIIWILYMKGQVDNSKCGWASMQVDWLFEKESVSELSRMVRYP